MEPIFSSVGRYSGSLGGLVPALRSPLSHRQHRPEHRLTNFLGVPNFSSVATPPPQRHGKCGADEIPSPQQGRTGTGQDGGARVSRRKRNATCESEATRNPRSEAADGVLAHGADQNKSSRTPGELGTTAPRDVGDGAPRRHTPSENY